MLQTAYDNEHVYKRWEYILTCMLGKDTGIPRIHRLRVIHLYECNLNLLFLIFFRELDQHCEDNFLINKGVYGCRPCRRAIDHVFVDVTQTEMAMVTRTTLIKFNNDATACFDRICTPTKPVPKVIWNAQEIDDNTRKVITGGKVCNKDKNRNLKRNLQPLRQIAGIWIRTG
jgi:hypothetical protein